MLRNHLVTTNSKSLLTRDILRTRWPVMNQSQKQDKIFQHNKQSLKGNYNIVYKFNENVLHGETDVKIEEKIKFGILKLNS